MSHACKQFSRENATERARQVKGRSRGTIGMQRSSHLHLRHLADVFNEYRMNASNAASGERRID